MFLILWLLEDLLSYLVSALSFFVDGVKELEVIGVLFDSYCSDVRWLLD